IVHELATNAAKYGALSLPGGKVRMTWSQSPEGQLAICWSEFGGPLVAPPTRNGFGSRVIKTLIDQTGGTIAVDWRGDGLSCNRAGPGCLNKISASISGASAGLGCQAEGQRGEVGLIGCGAVKARMWAPAVVEVEVTADRSARFAHAVVGSQIDLLVFDAAPQPLD